MKAKILGLLSAALLAGPMSASAGFIIDTDTSDEFDGTFSLANCGPSVSDQIFSKGLLLPGTSSFDGLSVSRGCSPEGKIGLLLATDKPGTSDNPLFEKEIALNGESFSGLLSGPGSYTNPADVTIGRVYWQFTGLTDTGGSNGTFSGAFCFSRSANGCTPGTAPEPGTLTLLGLGLAGLAASRRRKR